MLQTTLCPPLRPLVLAIWLATSHSACGQPLPHHYAGLGVAPDRTVTLSLDGSVSNLVASLSATILAQFSQMFDMYIAEELASHGYIVIAPDHSDCFKTEFPDGRYLTGAWGGDNASRFKDFQFLLDELQRLNASDPFFGGRLDLDRIGIYGLIYGGMVAEMCRRDDRLKCVALLEAENLQVPAAGLQKPFLAMNLPSLFRDTTSHEN